MPKAASQKPRILLTNDDGIAAPGMRVLRKIAAEISSDIWVVAPETEQSGAAHSLTLHVPVRIRKVRPKTFAVNGTPTDCVLLACQVLMEQHKWPDLVLSGVNRGSNAGDDVTYSGTVAGAMEAALLGIPAIALSQEVEDDEPHTWQCAAAHGANIVRAAMKKPMVRGTFLNVNFPACAPKQVRGVQVVPQGMRKMRVAYHERHDARGRPYYWIGGERSNVADRDGVDLSALEQQFITVTPLKLDLTDYDAITQVKKLF